MKFALSFLEIEIRLRKASPGVPPAIRRYDVVNRRVLAELERALLRNVKRSLKNENVPAA